MNEAVVLIGRGLAHRRMRFDRLVLLILVRTHSRPQQVETGGAHRTSGAGDQRSEYELQATGGNRGVGDLRSHVKREGAETRSDPVEFLSQRLGRCVSHAGCPSAPA